MSSGEISHQPVKLFLQPAQALEDLVGFDLDLWQGLLDQQSRDAILAEGPLQLLVLTCQAGALFALRFPILAAQLQIA